MLAICLLFICGCLVEGREVPKMTVPETMQILERALAQVREKTDFAPRTAIVLGSGLSGFVQKIDVRATVPLSSLEGFPVPSVDGHRGELLFGMAGKTPVVVLNGRAHYYEGNEAWQLALPIRLFAMLGVKNVVLTNAAGGMADWMKVGDFMLIRDHVSVFVPSPLRGPNLDAFGPRFPDMTEVYDAGLRRLAQEAAREAGISLREGVYVQSQGPNFETPAEIRLFARLGMDAVGMSTACEATVARHCGMRVCGISMISNLAAGISQNPLSAEEVNETGVRVAPKFQQLLWNLVQKL